MQSPIPVFGSLLAIALVVTPVLAQTMYKSTMPDGQVIYGDKPAPGAAKVEPTKVAPATKGVIPPTPGETQVLRQLEGDRARRDAMDGRARAAEKTLADAEAALAAGKEPREGERIGTASGASRLTDAYWERQKALESAVEKARRNLEAARATK
jgi:Domain of unknown function (DUF4124)